jgi:hypothetical protein
MKTPPNPTIAPDTLDNLLHALLDGDLPFPDLAARLGLSIADLAALITSPEVRQTIETLREALIQRSRLLSVTSQTAALNALCTVMDELGEAPARQQALEAEKAAAEKQSNTTKAEAATNALAALEARDKQLAELSRSARATLTYARATRAGMQQEIPQQSLRLAGGSE